MLDFINEKEGEEYLDWEWNEVCFYFKTFAYKPETNSNNKKNYLIFIHVLQGLFEPIIS